MTQYVHDLRLSDGEIILVEYLLDKHIEKLQEENTPIGTFVRKLKEKIIHSRDQLNP